MDATLTIKLEVRDQSTLDDIVNLIELQLGYIADNAIVTSSGSREAAVGDLVRITEVEWHDTEMIGKIGRLRVIDRENPKFAVELEDSWSGSRYWARGVELA